MSAGGGQSAHLPEPRAESLETDLGTVIQLLNINILIQNDCRFFDIFHVMWPSDSKPAADCIGKLDEWDTALFIVFIFIYSMSCGPLTSEADFVSIKRYIIIKKILVKKFSNAQEVNIF